MRTRPVLSIVVPTRNEAGNIEPLVFQTARMLRGENWELIFVDDSTDLTTVKELESASRQFPQVRYEHRDRGDGLSGAIIRGFALASGTYVAAMDGDLQHPPETLVRMLACLEEGADLVVASRFVKGGTDGGLNAMRRLVSLGARGLIWLGLSKTRVLTDPTSGCFAVRRDVLQLERLRAIGWKVLLEVFDSSGPLRVTEVPLSFAERTSGKSKLSSRQMTDLVRQVATLAYQSPDDRRFYLFALVGASGVALNMASFVLLTRLGLVPEVAAFLSAVAAMMSNFVLNDRYTYHDRRSGSVLRRSVRAIAAQGFGIAIDTGVVALSHAGLHLMPDLANGLGIVTGAIWNYGAFSRFVWRKKTTEVALRPMAGAVEVLHS